MNFRILNFIAVAVLATGICAQAQNLYVPQGSAGIQNSNSNFVGVGATVPTAAFHIQQTATDWTDGLRLSTQGKNWDIVSTNSGDRLSFGFGGTPLLEMNAQGRGSTVEIKGDLQLGLGRAIYFLGDAADPEYLIRSGGWLDGMMYRHYTSHQFYTSKSERLRITANGNIGIATANPLARLQIQQSGTTWSDGLRLGYLTKSWDIVTTNNGDRLTIGFGQTSNQGIELNAAGQGAALEVKGDLQMAQKRAIYFLGNAADPEYLIQSGDWNDGMKYKHFTSHQFFTDRTERLRILKNGYVGIGTPNPDALLTVRGDIHARELRLDMVGSTAPDYVFEESYNLSPLDSVENFIATHKHLPGVPSAADMEAEGVMIKEMNLLLLKKIEELTLYVIELKQENALQQKAIDAQQQATSRKASRRLGRKSKS
ncbi:tail fiber protein [Chryseolinea lacunae]|uniref:Peptidase S74 domain-containing protein n=1 Tax=Chryseolinea lacunae TaxID=2801331 RepID=A0ABS1KZY6_9BACT|nr:tail fiber protein [Chryseolinea lacunae]MBL0744807.1 hypothetical protein [Chryseolinea lacunae]